MPVADFDGRCTQATAEGRRAVVFREVQRLGGGGAATVFAGVDESSDTGTRTALKVFALGGGSRLRNEVRASELLAEVPHVVDVVRSLVTDDDRPVLEMTLYDASLEESSGPGSGVPDEQVCRWVREIATALDGAHAVGVFHRDVKRSNILLGEDDVAVLSDWETAAFDDELPAVEGRTDAYAPPEALDPHGDVDRAAFDRWGLAVTAFVALAGDLPSSAGRGDVAERVSRSPIPASGLSPQVRDVFTTALNFNPHFRFETATDFADVLTAAVAGGEGSRPAPVPPVDIDPRTVAPLFSDYAQRPTSDRRLFGRDRHLGALRQFVGLAEIGGGTVVVVQGAAGVGKTAIVRGMLESVKHPTRSAVVRGTPASSQVPYGAVAGSISALLLGRDPSEVTEAMLVDAIGRVVPRLTHTAPSVAAALGISTARAPLNEPTFGAHEVVRVLADLIDASLPRPSILVIDNLRHLDRRSVEVLRLIADRFATDRMLVIVSRPGERVSDIVAERGTITVDVPVGPLERAEVVELIRAVGYPGNSDPIVMRSGGNPLFARELASFTLEGELPSTIEELYQRRIDAVGPGANDIVRALALLGGPEERSTLVALAPDAVQLLTETAAASLVDTGDGTSDFRESQCAEAAVLAAEPARVALSERIAQTLDSLHAERPSAALVHRALHQALAAGDARLIWKYARLAARSTRGLQPESTVGEYWHLATTVADGVPRATRTARFEAHLNAADSFIRARLNDVADDEPEATRLQDRAHEHLAIAQTLAEDDAALIRAVRLQTLSLRHQGDYERSIEAIDTALDRLPTGDSAQAERDDLVVLKASCLHRLNEYERCRDVLEPLLDRPDTMSLSTRAHAYSLWVSASVDLGRAHERRYSDDEIMGLYQRGQDRRGYADALTNAGTNAYFTGDYATAETCYRRGRDEAIAVGYLSSAATALNNLGEIESDRGQMDAAIETFLIARDEFVRIDGKMGVGYATRNLGRSHVRCGWHGSGRDHLVQAIDIFREVRSSALELETELWLLESVIAETGQPDERGLDALARADGRDEFDALRLRLLASIAENDGHLDEAARLFGESAEQALDAGLLFEQALALSAVGRVRTLTGTPTASSVIEAAGGLFRSLGVVEGTWPWPTATGAVPSDI